ncbi:glutamate cyclase domain-containing protein [Thermococcus barophilus]|nr:glutamate cyclase domain-containing protein [Thermococcus barophilus]
MIAHIINTDIYGRGILKVYLEYRLRNFNFLKNAAKLLIDNSEKVLVVSSFPIPPMNICENDGPLGALALYKTVEKIGGKAEIWAHEQVKKALKPFDITFVEQPDVSEYSLLISVETVGRAKDGKYYSMSGFEVKTTTPFDEIFLEAKKLGIPTIGIGDGGNEIGMGKIRHLIEKYIPLGGKIASIVDTDELIVSAVSNWGAYGLVAQVSLEVGENLLEGWDERKNLQVIVSAGLIDGIIKKPAMSVDGISVDIHEKIVELLKETVNYQL